MAYDRVLAQRVRDALPAGDWVEKPMFGGLAFLLEGRMRVAVGHAGGLMLKLDEAEVAGVLDPPEVDLVAMGGRRMTQWVGVAGERLVDDASLRAWVERALESGA